MVMMESPCALSLWEAGTIQRYRKIKDLKSDEMVQGNKQHKTISSEKREMETSLFFCMIAAT